MSELKNQGGADSAGLLSTLLNIKGNVRACVYTEPLWGIPFSLYAPFVTVYMYALGIKDVQIGLLLSIGMVFQVIAAVFGGIVTDKMGRRLTTLVFDLISWSIPCLIWAFAQNFWWFLAAMILNSVWQITNNSWNCLLVEDCRESLMVNVYTWVHVSGLVSVFFAPLSYFFVEHFSMITTVRALYLFSFVSMTLKFLILFRYTTETEVGKRRKTDTASLSVWKMLKDYQHIVSGILKAPHTLFLIGFLVLYNITSLATGNFFGLYVTQNLHVSEKFLAVFPMGRALIILAFMLLFQVRLNRFPIKLVMGAGLFLFTTANLVLLLTPSGNLLVLSVFVIFDAVAFSLVSPRRDSMMVWFVDKEERARVNGVIYVLMIGFSIPFGWLNGYLSSLNRQLPFVLNIILFLICIMMVLRSRVLGNH